MIILIISVLILSCCLFILVRPTFLCKNHLFNILQDRTYLDTFSIMDMRVRDVSSVTEYIEKNIKSSLSSFTSLQKLRLIWLSTIIDIKILNSKRRTYMDPFKFAKVPWKFGLVDGSLYEDGLSHTRHGVIILSTDTVKNYTNQELVRTLIHEKAHVYQYLYPNDIQKYIREKNLKIHSKRTSRDRANPDTDEFIYVDKEGNQFRASYIQNAKSITDVKYKSGNTQFFEHPYESMAIQLESIVK